jgi:hypothetical protein
MLLLAACGGQTAATGTESDQQERALLAYNTCLQQHGVTIVAGHGGGSTASRATMEAAERACRPIARRGGISSAPTPDPAQLDAWARFAACMRQQGVNMADPKPNPGGGVSIDTGGLDPSSSPYKQAEATCKKYEIEATRTR